MKRREVRGSVVHSSIQAILRTAAVEFESIGVVSRVSVPEHAGYEGFLYQHRGLIEHFRELIVLPSSEDTRLESVLASFERADTSIVFIDCFSSHQDFAGEATRSILAPIDLWKRIVGRAPQGIPEEESVLLKSEYVDRFITEVAPSSGNGNDEFVLGDPWPCGDALDCLRKWAALSPFEEPSLVVFDERGAGKTWLLKRFAVAQTEIHERFPWEVRPAFYVNLADYADRLLRQQGIEKSLAYFLLERSKLQLSGLPVVGDVFLLDAVIRSGQAILLLDSLDELASDVVGEEMAWHVQRLIDFLPVRCKSIVATRGTRFRSLEFLSKTFVPMRGAPFPFEPSVGTRSGGLVARHMREPEVQRYAPRYRLLRLVDFSAEDVASLAARLGTIGGALNNKWSDSLMAQQCTELAAIPACAANLVELRCDPALSPFRCFELIVLYELIDFNIRTGRALPTLRYKDGTEVRERDLDLPLRLRVLEHVSWQLVETGRDSFDPSLVAYTFLEENVVRFEALISDLSAQTVFELSSHGARLRFRLETIWAYFLARYLYSSLFTEGRGGRGGEILGRHDLTNSTLGRRTLAFLGALLEEGTEVPSQDQAGDRHRSRKALKAAIMGGVSSVSLFSPWTRHLAANVGELKVKGVDCSTLEWVGHDVGSEVGYEDGLDVIVEVSEPDLVEAFKIGRREVTNAEFEEFLASDWVPRLVPVVDQKWRAEEVVFERRTLCKSRCSRIAAHPLCWASTHPRVNERLEEDRKEPRGRFRCFTNDFHLYQWRSTELPLEIADEPLVWASFYVAAMFCNWRTGVRFGFGGMAAFYRIFLDDNRFPRLIRLPDTLGYRLPFATEWRYAARAGEDEAKYAWESVLSAQRKLYRELLLEPQWQPRSVMSSAPNAFGVYGMLGNVREWCHEGKLQEKSQPTDVQFGRILGSNWALEESFRYDFPGMSLPKMNTNIDVGFRLAQSLSRDARDEIVAARKARTAHVAGAVE